MLDALIALARGPLLAFSLLLMAAGLLRALLRQLWEIGWAWRRAGDIYVPWKVVLRRNLAWLLPWRYLRSEERFAYNFTSFLFHLGIIVVPVFLAGHIALWKRAFGISWIALPATAADVLTGLTVAALVGLLIGRGASRASRSMSTLQDWLLPVLCLLPMASGWLLAHPAWFPWDTRLSWLLHLLSAEVLLVLVPFSKLVHIVLFWVSQGATELGWRFPPGFGHRVRASLGKEGQGL